MLLALCLLLAAETAPLSDVEVWNNGVAAYRRGDTTNALATMKTLLLSKTHGARAAEVVAKLKYDEAHAAAGDPSGGATPLPALEEAADAAQIALRAAPNDARVQRNFTRATDGLQQLRETQRINDVLKKAQGQDPSGLLRQSTYDARQLMTDAGVYRTNAAERAVMLADQLSRRAERMADAWLCVREVISQSVTNQEQAATILAQIQEAQERTTKAARELGDLSDDAYGRVGLVESDFTRFLKLIALPPVAVEEDLIAQSNAWQDVEAFNGRDWQREALDYTRSFRSKFPAWARAYEQQAQADTNKPPFTAEDQAKVSALATELEKLQISCAEKALPPSQEKAIGILRQIKDLLPKDKNGGGQNQQQQNPQQQNQQQQNKDPQQQNQDPQQQNQDQQQNKDQQQDASDQKQDQDPQQQPEEQPADEKKEASEEPKEDSELEALLKKAEERNDEHEAEKKARMRKAPLPPNERDW